MTTCTACGNDAEHVRPAYVFMGPGDLRAGQVCEECAALGWLLCMGSDAPLPTPLVEKGEAVAAPVAGKRAKRSERSGKRKRGPREPEPPPLPLPKSSREQVLWKAGIAAQLLNDRRARAVAPASESSVPIAQPAAPSTSSPPEGWTMEEDALYQKFKARLMSEAPALVRVLAENAELEVAVERKMITIDGSSLKGRAAQLIAAGFFIDSKKTGAVVKEMKRTGREPDHRNLGRALDEYVDMGLLTREPDGYRVAPGAQVRIREAG